MQWSTFSQYQHGAPISEKGWNHLRLVMGGGRLRLSVAGAPDSPLDMPRLQGSAKCDGIAVMAPVVCANLVVRSSEAGEPARRRRSMSGSAGVECPLATTCVRYRTTRSAA